MDTLHLFIAVTLALITTAQGIPHLRSLLGCMYKYYLVCFLLTEQVSAIALMEILSLSRTQLILVQLGMFNTASVVNGGDYADVMDTRHCGMTVKLQLLVGSWDIIIDQ